MYLGLTDEEFNEYLSVVHNYKDSPLDVFIFLMTVLNRLDSV